MNEKELLMKAIDVMNKNPYMASFQIKKALRQVKKKCQELNEEWEKEAMKPDVFIGKVF